MQPTVSDHRRYIKALNAHKVVSAVYKLQAGQHHFVHRHLPSCIFLSTASAAAGDWNEGKNLVMGINLPIYSTCMQRFNFRFTVPPETLFDQKKPTYPPSHPSTHGSEKPVFLKKPNPLGFIGFGALLDFRIFLLERAVGKLVG